MSSSWSWSSSKKEYSTSRSFGREVSNIDSLKESISSFAANCARKLRDQNTVCKKVSVFIKTNSFKPNKSNIKVIRY